MSDRSRVYFINLDEIHRIKELLPEFIGPLGVKVHFGEEGNITYIKPDFIKPIVKELEFSFIETCTLYNGQRSTATLHKKLAAKHGFDFAPVDILDGKDGREYNEVKIKGEHFKKCYIGKGIDKYRSLLVISHFKGHGGVGFGGAIKNLAMGLASRQGKLAQHSSIQHQVNKHLCIGCGTCINNCPVNAIVFDANRKAEINDDICIGCSKCIGVCPKGAIEIPWASTAKETLAERVAEYALAAVSDKHCFYINFLVNIVKDCDCWSKEFEKMTSDIGALASKDPVAIDQASFDLVTKRCEAFKKMNSDHQLAHAEKIGLGIRAYELINFNKNEF